MATMLAMSDICTRLSTTGPLLVRSGIEIERLLNSMADDGDPVTATLPPSVMFLSRVVSMDPDEQSVTLAYSDHKPANSAMLASPSVTFRCNHRGAQFAFACKKPRHAMHSGQPAIRIGAPSIVIGAQARHGLVRSKLPKEAEVNCDVRMGLISFAARLVDVGLDGKAYIIGAPAIPLCDGTRLTGARIHAEGHSMAVDLDVDKVVQAVLPDGKRATRIGCRVLAKREELERIIRLFIVDLA